MGFAPTLWLKDWESSLPSRGYFSEPSCGRSQSAFLGLGVGVALMISVAASSSPSLVGRYQIGATASHGLIIDTTTGQVWSYFLPQGSGGQDADFFKPKRQEGSEAPRVALIPSRLFPIAFIQIANAINLRDVQVLGPGHII